MTNWLEVSLTVNGELAEAVADVLARFAPNGVTTEQGVEFLDDEDLGSPSGPVTVRAYLPADERLEETRQRLEESLYYLGMIQPIPAPTYTPIADQNWMEAWKARYQPIPIGERLIIVPAWLESPDPSRVPIRIDPGMAFGTGTHPTTQLCLEFVESFFDDGSKIANPEIVNRKSDVIDVGCGSAILSVAALKLGASRALGVDIDEASITASRENAEANRVADKLLLGLGSVDEILAGQFEFRQAPLVLANILAPVLVRLLEAGLGELVAPGGVLVLSGILDHQAESVIEAAQAQNLGLVEQRQIGDWVALAFIRQ
ncbi:MAG: 50S ribosomal protein L11 methyltransferase [Chloroflexota bacterium]